MSILSPDFFFFFDQWQVFIVDRKQFHMSKVEHIVSRRQCVDAFPYSNEWTFAGK